MTYRTTDDLAVRFDRPSPEALARETCGQISAMWQLCQILAGGESGDHALLPARLRRKDRMGSFAGSTRS